MSSEELLTPTLASAADFEAIPWEPMDSADSAVPPILAALRARTEAIQARLDAGLNLLSAGLSRTRYRAVLAAFHGYYLPLEARLGRLEGLREAGLELASRRKCRLLGRDLLALGLTADALSRLPICAEAPEPRSLLEAFGCLYVMESATRGGQGISQHVARNLGLPPSNGSAFFHGYGAETGRRWKQLIDLLTTVSAEPQAERIIVDRASETFLHFERWLTRRGLLR